MKTGNLEYIRSIYNFDSCNKDGTKRDYLISDKSKSNIGYLITEKIRISKDNGFHKRSRYFEYWLYFRNGTNWETNCTKTGLAITIKKMIFEGNIPQTIDLYQKNEKGKDWENPKHLIIIEFSDDAKTIVLDLFKDFYPYKKELINLIISEHQSHFKSF